ncbi:MAG: hypothetical protein M0Q45_07365 [Bacteroidales bacterium]|nr:hypothetical protein [Bacteroidales bacterium]MCK9499307.1 hypothetical protein [Bacteroidales bacterium]MDY0313830.1 hypothetical protein [Bacteroidales bacterium]
MRLKNYDYSQAGLYFITICIDSLKNPGMMPFGQIINGKMILNDAGKMVEKLWQRSFWDNIIRNEQAYQRISNYIKNNPAKWADDKFFKT